ncbi:hypothetical protein ABT352_33185 [Streptosporangium sp. NPDC000563]|uniref:hypothetical protein n=1 Tax=Streptosporangium sp. NPDC000563 TaxID=3154366 RepID=UPI0033175799
MSTPTAPAALAFPTGGACTNRPNLMTPNPDDTQAVDAAIETCLSCSAYVQCLAWITATPTDQDPGGIIAALTETDRGLPTPRRADPDEKLPDPDTRRCTRCKTVKNRSEFYAHQARWCIDCRRAYGRDRYHQLNPGARHYEPVEGRTQKACPDCDQTKPLKDFHRNQARPDGHASICKPCLKIRRKNPRLRKKQPA